MSCTKKGYKSIFGYPQRTCLVYIDKLEKIFNRKYEVLIPDALDGQHALSFARKGHIISCYETNDIYLDGGFTDGFNCIGLKKRINYENLDKNVNLEKKNFYEEKINNKYDFVYSYRSLHLKKNKEIPMSRKVRKLLSSVKINGYIYIFYHLATDESDYEKYPKEQYLRLGDMKKYFDIDNWEIINIIERENDMIHRPHPDNNKVHYHRVGYVFARKKNNRLKYRLNYEITIENEFDFKKG